jgi:hypothetical protein
MTHSELVRKIINLASRLGLLAHHCGDSRRCHGAAGFPDVLAAGPGGLLLAEIKTGTADTTPQQDLWGWTITQVSEAACASGGAYPVRYRVWREADWDNGTIERELKWLT